MLVFFFPVSSAVMFPNLHFLRKSAYSQLPTGLLSALVSSLHPQPQRCPGMFAQKLHCPVVFRPRGSHLPSLVSSLHRSLCWAPSVHLAHSGTSKSLTCRATQWLLHPEGQGHRNSTWLAGDSRGRRRQWPGQERPWYCGTVFCHLSIFLPRAGGQMGLRDKG